MTGNSVDDKARSIARGGPDWCAGGAVGSGLIDPMLSTGAGGGGSGSGAAASAIGISGVMGSGGSGVTAACSGTGRRGTRLNGISKVLMSSCALKFRVLMSSWVAISSCALTLWGIGSATGAFSNAIACGASAINRGSRGVSSDLAAIASTC